MQVWILTFQRPRSLNRLINNLGSQGINCNVWSNSPVLSIDLENERYMAASCINSVNTIEASSWCARSWNSIYIKGFEHDDEIVCLQDDTNVSPNFVRWIEEEKKRYDFMFGPAGDQFHYIHKRVLQKVGWWDERYNGCLCGDAEYLKRVYFEYDKSRVSVEESHGWGFTHNPSGITQHVIPWTQHNIIEPDYKNQWAQLEELDGDKAIPRPDIFNTNVPVIQARRHFVQKWGVPLEAFKPVIHDYKRLMPEIDFYPWASKKFGITKYIEQEVQENWTYG
jgi:hypothetical protein